MHQVYLIESAGVIDITSFEEIEKIFPELVKTAEDEMGTKSVNYVGLIAPMIEAGTKTLVSPG